MTTRDFFITAIKLFGLYSLVMAIYSSLAYNLITSIMGADAGLIGMSAASLIVMGTFFWLLTFQAHWIVDRLKLVRGLSGERIEFGGLTSVQIVKAGIFLTGVFVIVDSIPEFLNLAYWSIRGGISGMLMAGEDNSQLAIKALEILFGWLLATNFDWLAQKISPKEQEQTSV